MNTKHAGETRLERVVAGTCAHCGNVFEPARPHQRYCRPSCRQLAFTGRREPAQRADDPDALFRVPFE